MKKILSILFLTFLITQAFAQSPQAFNYQGVARDASGNPLVAQAIKLRFSILQGTATGNDVFQETHALSTSSTGLFSLQVGTGTVINGVFSTIDWGIDNYYLKVELDENGGDNFQLIGTTQLLSVPYALHAGNGTPWIKNDEGIVFINSENPSSHEANLPKHDRDVVVISDDDSSTGIRLEEAGEGGETYSLTSTGDLSSLGGGKFIIYHDSDDAASSAAEKAELTITKEGNTGISTAYPKAKLQVSDGDIYIEDVNKGVIMKSPNGNCWRMTVSNQGTPVFTMISCPE